MQLVQAQRITLAEAAIAVKAPPAMTFSATMLAYTYISLCPDPKLKSVVVLIYILIYISYKLLNTVVGKRTSIEALIFHTAPDSFTRSIIG